MQILCLLCFIATLGSSYQFIQVIKRIDASKSIQDATNVLFVDLLKAATGQMGYILTTDQDYLAQYNTGIDRAKNDVITLVHLTADDPDHVPVVKEMTTLVDDEMTELANAIELRKTRGLLPAATEVDLDRGKNIMDNIRVHIDTVDLHETTKFLHDEADGITYGRIAFIAMMLTLLSGLFLVRRTSE